MRLADGMSGLNGGVPEDPLRPLARQQGRMTFGVLIPHFGAHASRQRIVAGSMLVERLGFDAVWVRDHLLWTPHGHEGTDLTFVEPLAALAAIASVTERIYLGTAVLIPLRWPLKLAQDLAALSYLSGGRVIAGLGTGHNHEELAAAGFDADERREILAETVVILRRIWSEDVVTHAGPRFPFESVRIEPKPVRALPIWYGGTTRASVRAAVAAYDGWMPSGMPIDTLDDRLAYMAERAAEADRPAPSVSLVPRVSIARSRAEARRGLDVHALSTGSEGSKFWLKPKSGSFDTIDDLRGIVVVGDPDEVVDQILELSERPIDHFVFDLRGQFDRYEESLELIAERVLPSVRAKPANGDGVSGIVQPEMSER
jgi:probable F420-dependent oxidoreductase